MRTKAAFTDHAVEQMMPCLGLDGLLVVKNLVSKGFGRGPQDEVS